MLSMFQKIKQSLTKTRTDLMNRLGSLLPAGITITDDVLDEVEEALYEADLGVHASELVVEKLRERSGEINFGRVDPYQVIRETIRQVLDKPAGEPGIRVGQTRPHVILVVGVNGTGKTTTIGKLAMRFRSEGRSVLLAACDTFRAAAVEQLEIWSKRAGTEFIRSSLGADPASVAFDAMQRAEARGTEVVIIDTAGRLHTSRNLMEELKKIRKVLRRVDESAPHETLLVLDATTGHNALNQTEIFERELAVSGIVLTKLDGTAKGGIVVSIVDKFGVPVKLIGVGEGIDDLRDFEPELFVDALFARETE